MEKRRSKRKPVNLLEAELVTGSKNFPCVIENISESGLYMITASKKNVTSFIPEEIFNLKFQTTSGKETSLHCEVRWVHINKTPIHGLTYRMGMEIIKRAPVYKEFLDNL